MLILVVWLIIGALIVALLTSDEDFASLGLLESTAERAVVILAWPGAIAALALFPFCRDENEKVEPKL